MVAASTARRRNFRRFAQRLKVQGGRAGGGHNAEHKNNGIDGIPTRLPQSQVQ